MNQTFIGC
uniref:Uncharacterized protein n=1 Tax=Moniliophthora roreri TaxID=221103 RepID=A0A0W0FSU8_MONRR